MPSTRMQTVGFPRLSPGSTHPTMPLRRSIRAGHAQDVLADISEDQIGRDRGSLVDPYLAPFALDVVLLGEGETTEGLEGRVGGGPGCFRGEEIGHVGVGADFPPGIEQGRGAAAVN